MCEASPSRLACVHIDYTDTFKYINTYEHPTNYFFESKSVKNGVCFCTILLTLPFEPFPVERSYPKPLLPAKINKLMENAGPWLCVYPCVCVSLVGICVSKQGLAMLDIALR